MKNISWQQAIVLVACIAAPVVAYKFLASPEAAMAATVVGMVINFLMGRSDPPEPPSGGTKLTAVVGGIAACMALSGCYPDPQDPSDALSKCAAEARAAYYVDGATVEQAMHIYEQCKIREGVQ